MNYVINYHALTRRKRVGANHVPNMTSDWKKGIRKKRLFAKLYAKNKTEENFKLKKKYRNLATKERRKAIKQSWKMKSEKIRENPRDFVNTFQPFINKKTAKNNPITLNIDGNDTENDAVAVINCFADYFARYCSASYRKATCTRITNITPASSL